MLFKHFASKNQLTGLSVNGTLIENGLTVFLTGRFFWLHFRLLLIIYCEGLVNINNSLDNFKPVNDGSIQITIQIEC